MECQEFPFARESAASPPSQYLKLRQTCPVSKVKLPSGNHAWLLTTHEDIRTALSSDKVSADPRTPGYPLATGNNPKPTIVTLDDPEHSRLRKALDTEFSSEAVDGLRLLIHGVVDAALDDIDKRFVENHEPFDLIEEFAAPVPTRIICKIVGIPASDVEWLAQDTSLCTRDAVDEEEKTLMRYLGGLVDCRISRTDESYGEDRREDTYENKGKGEEKGKVHEGLISKLVRLWHDTGNFTRDEVVSLVYVVLTAGNTALLNSIGLGVLSLFENEEQWHKVRRNPLAFGPGLAAECLRFNTTSALDCRRAVVGDLVVRGKTIRKGEGVICALQSADRDEAVTEKPDVFDVSRKYPAEDLLGFGYGTHRCIGEHLAKATLEIALATLFARFPGLKLHGHVDDVEFTAPTENIGVVKLPVIVDDHVQLHRIIMPD
ncbi:cytochrome P450 [Xylaria curta]|nr:cytochrome P450 [Xylaria curta]